jgi:protease I
MTESTLTGRRLLAIVSNYGVEQDELVVPVEQLREAGAEVTVAAVSDEPVQTLVGDKDPGRTVTPDARIADVDAEGYDGLLIPGGTINADNLRLDKDAIGVVRSFARSGRPIAAICHGPWALVEADVLSGATLTSYASLATDIRNAGAAEWRDEAVVTDAAAGFLLITSRDPGDLPSFVPAIEKALAG